MVLHEKLQAISDVDRTFKYSIDDGPSPVSREEVSHCIGTVIVRPVTQDNAAFVESRSHWEAQTDEAENFSYTMYTGLLEALKKHYAA